MKGNEARILRSVSHTLYDSTKTNWSTGDFEAWTKWARHMKTIIRSQCSTLDSMIEIEDEDITDEQLLKVLVQLDELGFLNESTGKIYKSLKEKLENE